MGHHRSLTRDQHHTPCIIGRWGFNHWTSRDIPGFHCLFFFSCLTYIFSSLTHIPAAVPQTSGSSQCHRSTGHQSSHPSGSLPLPHHRHPNSQGAAADDSGHTCLNTDCGVSELFSPGEIQVCTHLPFLLSSDFLGFYLNAGCLGLPLLTSSSGLHRWSRPLEGDGHLAAWPGCGPIPSRQQLPHVNMPRLKAYVSFSQLSLALLGKPAGRVSCVFQAPIWYCLDLKDLLMIWLAPRSWLPNGGPKDLCGE